MNLARQSDAIYGALARIGGLALVVSAVTFQRRGLMDWTEWVFLGLCIGLQETFLRLPSLRRFRTGMLVVYSVLPLVLIGLNAPGIMKFRGEFVPLVLNTPLPLVVVSIQIMVLYLREGPRLTSVVMVLALFSTVIGVRRPDVPAGYGPVWLWLALICSCASLYLVLQHPSVLFSSLLYALGGRPTTQNQGARPASALRPEFLAMIPVLVLSTVATSGLLFFLVPRPSLRADSPVSDSSGAPKEGGPGQHGGGGRTGGPGGRTGPGGGDGTVTMSGLNNGVGLGDFGSIQLDKRNALDVRPLGTASERISSLYLRTYTFGEFDGERWSPLAGEFAPRKDVEEGSRRNLPDPLVFAGPQWTLRSYEVRVHAGAIGAGGELAMPVQPHAVSDLAGPLNFGRVDGTVRAPLAKPESTYVAEAVELTASENQMQAALAGVRSDAREVPSQYLSLPLGLREKIAEVYTFYPELEQRANARNTTNPVQLRGAWATARRIVSYFHGAKIGGEKAWKYSLEFRPLPGPDPIVRFLDLKTAKGERYGHCEYFASAMVVLLRCFGIPARVCAGFHASAPDEAGVFHVTFASAHAWVEAWMPGFGWLTFDPTPAEERGGTSQPTPVDPEPDSPAPPPVVEKAVDATQETASGSTSDWFADFDSQRQSQWAQSIGAWLETAMQGMTEILAAATAWMPAFVPDSPWLRGLLLAAPPLLIGLHLGWRKQRKRRQVQQVLGETAKDARRRERGLYAQLLLLLARYGHHKQATETPMEFAQRIASGGGQQHAALPQLTSLYYGFRFGSRATMVDEFKAALSRYASTLKASVQDAGS
ncbi:MAG: DUF3488 domain-containing protein [Planctomycetes bacterium]|nr:DUF3488 domain-containing protein [Planctomycetota bacterium]